jgi:hypothetical protein
MMSAWNYENPLRRVDNPILEAIRSSGVDSNYAGMPITPILLEGVGAVLTTATRCICVAFREVDLVPAAEGMVRVRIAHTSGQIWTVTALKRATKNAAN